MRSVKFWALVVAAFLLSLPLGSVLAQDEVLPACSGSTVSGTVVSVDPLTGMVTVETAEGLCTLSLSSGTYRHPVIALFDSYYGVIGPDNAGELAEALVAVHGWAVYDPETGQWEWAAETTPDAVKVQVIAIIDDADGTYTLQLKTEPGEIIEIITGDAGIAASLSENLEKLNVSWKIKVNEDGSACAVDVGDQVAAYLEQGIGLGALAKFYAIAAESQEACVGEDTECALSVDYLVARFQSGTGLGELFKEYGKPAILGIGHIRQDEKFRNRDGEQNQIKSNIQNTHKEMNKNENHPGIGNGLNKPDGDQPPAKEKEKEKENNGKSKGK